MKHPWEYVNDPDPDGWGSLVLTMAFLVGLAVCNLILGGVLL